LEINNNYVKLSLKMVRYKEYVKKMLDENESLFEQFRTVHDKYARDDVKYQAQLNQIGEKVLEVVKEYENRVCANTERSYSQYSANLAEKFQNEIRRVFPMFDFIGVKIKTVRSAPNVSPFKLKKLL